MRICTAWNLYLGEKRGRGAALPNGPCGLDFAPPDPVAQWIERPFPKREVACSSHAGVANAIEPV